MKGWKEKKSKLVQWISDLTQSQYNICFGLFIVWGVLLLILASRLFFVDSFHIDKDSARYLLSALVQSQAAIVAIVVTLTLVAIQLVVSSYSLRAIDMFKKIPMWWFLTCYGASIFYGLFVLGLIREDVPLSEFISSYPISLESCIYFAYWFGFVTFALLIVYMGEIFIFLEPSNIIERLSDNISKEKISKHIKSLEEHKKDRTKPIEEDPVQPIVDIIRSSLIKHDFATTSSGINKITNRAIEVMNPDEHEISKHFCNHFERIGKLAVNRGDEESVIEVIKNLEAFGESAAKRESVVTIANVAKCIRSVGKTAAGKRYADATRQAILCIRSVGKTATENSTGNSLDSAVYQVARSIGAVGLSAEENELRDEVWQAARSLVLVRIFVEGKRFEEAKQQAFECLARLATSSKEIVESAIETTLRGKDPDFVDGFMKSLKQYKLDEKLQSEKPETSTQQTTKKETRP